MNKDSKIYIAGNTGMVGSSIVRNLLAKGYTNLVFTPYPEYDLIQQEQVRTFFEKEKPEYVFLAAARVGGIVANNTYRGQFVYENLMIQNNIIHASYEHRIQKLLFLGSSCIYPKDCPQPIREEYLLTGVLEYTNEPYAIAKIAGIKMCESYNLQYGTDFISVMPTNLYGPNDNFDLEKSHVLPALIRKMHLGTCLMEGNWKGIRADFKKRPVEGLDGDAPEELIRQKLSQYGILQDGPQVQVMLWGSGTPRREFLHADDLADACVYLMENTGFSQLAKDHRQEVRNTHINIGCGQDQSIRELAELVRTITGFAGELAWDRSKPDGTLQKLLDVSKLNTLGWKPKIALTEGIKEVYHNHY